jgi:phenylacetate-coenzyme A ligase PaaK-like adenylate-forming protein
MWGLDMGLYTKLAASALFPIHEKLKGHSTIEVFRAMERSQWLSPKALEELQTSRLRTFLQNISQNVPYYRDLFARLKFDPGAISCGEDIRALPLVGKPEIRANIERLKAGGAKGLQRFNTGGSSGEPLIFYLDQERVSHDVAAKRRATRWWGVDIGDREIVVWGSPIELGAQDRLRQARDLVFRTELISAFEMSETKLTSFVNKIVQKRPKMLFGYPSSISFIAKYAVDRNIALDNLGISVVFVTSERLYDHQREQIELAFGCPVANGYGGRDAGFIAHQCPQGSMHITSDDILVETVDADGQSVGYGQPGELVITHFATAAFPFVRYRTGDVGVLSDKPCACGRGLPVLEEIQGRSTDFIVAQDGTVLHGLALIYVLRDIPEVQSFKIIQETRESICVQIIAGDGFSIQSEVFINSEFKKRLGKTVEVKIEKLSNIPAEKSGKFRYVVSKVQL